MEELNTKFAKINVKYRSLLMKQREMLDTTEFDEQKYQEFMDDEAQEDLMEEAGKLMEIIYFDILIDSSSITFNYNHYNSLPPAQQEFARLYLFSYSIEKKKQWKIYKKSWETCEPNDKQTSHILLCSELAEKTLKLLEKH